MTALTTTSQQLAPLDLTAGIQRIAAELRKGITLELPVSEFVAEGFYFRTITIPKGVVLVGKKHRGPCRNLCFGDLLVATAEGTVRLQGCHEIMAPAGVQRAGYALEDTLWVCIHETTETDLSKMEALFTYPEDETLDNSATVLLDGNAAVKLIEKGAP